jgi:hypothetical protein
MNAVEIEEAVSQLVAEPFDRTEFPYQFLAAYGFGETTLKKLRVDAARSPGSSGGAKKAALATDVENAVLLRNQIHLLVCDRDDTGRARSLLQ